MKLKYQEVRIRQREGACIIQRRAPAWEVPILQAIHEGVTVVADVCEDRPAPSVSREFARLEKAYGFETDHEGSRGPAVVAAVYGQHQLGLQSLRRAMQDSVLPMNTPVTPIAAPPPLRADLLTALASDSLNDLIGASTAEPAASEELTEVAATA
jgi:hypothetical protein